MEWGLIFQPAIYEMYSMLPPDVAGRPTGNDSHLPTQMNSRVEAAHCNLYNPEVQFYGPN